MEWVKLSPQAEYIYAPGHPFPHWLQVATERIKLTDAEALALALQLPEVLALVEALIGMRRALCYTEWRTQRNT